MNLKKTMGLKVKFINEKKDRVTVLHIENLTKPLYQVFLKRLDLYFIFFIIFNLLRKSIVKLNDADFKLPYTLILGCQN